MNNLCCLPLQQSVKTSIKIEVTHMCKCVLRHQFPTAIQLGKNKEPKVAFRHIFSLNHRNKNKHCNIAYLQSGKFLFILILFIYTLLLSAIRTEKAGTQP